jgi:hypothetical protein
MPSETARHIERGLEACFLPAVSIDMDQNRFHHRLLAVTPLAPFSQEMTMHTFGSGGP